MSEDALGDRMKDYEKREAGPRFMPMLPIYARIDGRGFSRFTKGLELPFDADFRRAMVDTTRFLVEQTNARLGYTQSDEISLCWLSESYDGEVFFGGRKQKMISQLAALASIRFARALWQSQNPKLREKAELDPTFDARVFQLPNKMECANAFVWREQDATKNALSMAVRSLYPHKAMEGKSRSEQHEMLFAKGVNFNDYPAAFKRGVYVARREQLRPLTDEELAKIPENRRPAPDYQVSRSRIMELDLPPLGRVANKVEVVFEGAQPQLAPEAEIQATKVSPRP